MSELLPSRAARYDRRSRLQRLALDRWDLIAGAVILTFLAATYWLVAGGGLYIDDIRAQAYAAGRPFWPFVVESNQTHLAPSARTIDWLQASFAPLQHWPAQVVTLLIATAFAVSLWICARWVAGHPAAGLVGLTLGLFGATIVPSLAWYRQALTGIASLTMLLIVLILSVRFIDGGHWWRLPAMSTLHVVALGFSERALLAPVLLLALIVWLRSGFRGLFWRGMVALSVLSVINVVFLAFYFAGDFDKAEGAQPTVYGFLYSTSYSIIRNTIPAYLGGPIVWGGDGIYGSARTPLILVIAASCIAIVLLGLAAWRDRAKTVRLLATASAYILPIYVIVYVGRVAQVTDLTSVNDLRLHSDAAVIGALCVGGLLGVVLGSLRDATRAALGKHITRWGRSVAAAVIVLAVVGSLFSWRAFGQRWHTNPSGDYFVTLDSALSRHSGTVVPGPVPESIVPWWVQPDFSTERLVALLHPGTETALERAPVTVVAPDGSLTDARLLQFDNLPTGRGFCGLAVPSDMVAGLVPATEPIPARRHQLLRIGLLVGDTTRIGVAFIDEHGTEHVPETYQPPLVHRGPNRIIAPMPHGREVHGVIVKTLDRNTAGLCITSVTTALSGATL